MGVIQRQGIKHSIVNFAGLAIGIASTLFVYSRQDVVEAYGLVQFLLSIGIIGLPLFSLSANTVAIRFFPRFEDKTTGHHGFISLVLLMCLAGWGICLLIALLARGPIEHLLTHNSPLLSQFLWMALPLALFFTISAVLGTYSINFRRIVIPSILIDFTFKIFLPIQMVAIWQGWISIRTAIWLLLAHYFLVMMGMIIYLDRLNQWHLRLNWSFITPELRRDMARYAGFGIINSFALLLATKADTLMVGSLTTMKSTGIYAVALNIAAAIEIPTKSMYGASLSFVAKYLADENWTEMEILYRKVSVNLLLAGLFIFGCIWLSVNDLYALMPNSAEMSAGKYVLLFLSLAKLVDMGASLNNQLVYYSTFYRYSMFSLIILAIANIGFNLWLIPLWGLTGAAVAVLLSITCYNLFSLALVWIKFRMQPFSKNTLVLFGLALLAMGVVWFLPSTGYLAINIVVRSGAYALIFGGLAIYLRVSPDLNDMLTGLLSRLRKN